MNMRAHVSGMDTYTGANTHIASTMMTDGMTVAAVRLELCVLWEAITTAGDIMGTDRKVISLWSPSGCRTCSTSSGAVMPPGASFGQARSLVTGSLLKTLGAGLASGDGLAVR